MDHGVRQFTGGRIGVAQLETGADTRALAAITVNIRPDPGSDACGCGSYKIRARTIAHEVGHALGVWHIAGSRGVMTGSAAGCPPAEYSPEELHHGAIAYQRAVGNLDPDADPQTTAAQQLRGATVDSPVISCRQ